MTTPADIKSLMGKNLSRLRKLKKLTQEDLASKINTSASHIAQMESGKGIGSEVLAKLCNALNVEASEFYAPVLYKKEPEKGMYAAEEVATYGTELFRVVETVYEIKNQEDKEYIGKLLDILHGDNQQGAYALKLIIDQTWAHRSEKKGVTVSEVSKKEAQKA